MGEIQLMRHEVAHAIAALQTGNCVHADIERCPDEGGMFTNPKWADNTDMVDLLRCTVAGRLAPVADMSDDDGFLDNVPAELVAQAFAWCEAHVAAKVASVTDKELIKMVLALNKHGTVRIMADQLH